MKWVIVLAVVVAIVAVVGTVLVRLKAARGEGVWPFYAKKALTQPEQVLYFRLVKAFPECIVLAQVQLSRILGVKKGANAQSWLNRINRMSADFVICHKDATVLAVIELDDASHQRERRVVADAKKDKALAAAGIKLLRWQGRDMADEATIRGMLFPAPVVVPRPHAEDARKSVVGGAQRGAG
jgi:very-short-patch-repair endonuclease